MRANPNAINDELSTVPIVTKIVTKKLFLKNSAKLFPPKPA